MDKSAQFKEFMKYLSKGSTYGKKPPDVKKLLGCPEYMNYETMKSLNVEIREWFIPVGNNKEKSLKLLLFLVTKLNKVLEIIFNILIELVSS